MAALVIGIGGCLVWDVKDGDSGAEVAIIPGTWVHAFEEDGADGIQVYRPDTYRDFPASRFRMRYVFRRGGQCEWYFLAPTDGHFMKPGTYRIDGDTLKVQQDAYEVAYRIHATQPDVLRLELLPNEYIGTGSAQ